MSAMVAFSILFLLQVLSVHGLPTQKPEGSGVFDVQGHRGGRGNTIENTLPSFAWGMIDGVTTLELDNGVTKDRHVIVWHDENILDSKCRDTAPAFKNDPDFPYVGKFIANLTLAQVKTLDCSLRQTDFPMQLTYPGTRLSTLPEFFDFVACTDPQRKMHFNIESKIDPQFPNQTLGVQDFVQKQHADFVSSRYPPSNIVYQSFDWRTLIAMKALDARFATSALIQFTTAVTPDNSTSPWLAGLRPDNFPGATLGEQISNAAASIHADILSPSALGTDAGATALFTTREMIQQAHKRGLTVIPWTVDDLNTAQQLLDFKTDGIISDFPDQMRRFIHQQEFNVSPQFSEAKVLACLAKHLQTS